MSTASRGRATEHLISRHLQDQGFIPVQKASSPLCECGCGYRTSAKGIRYIIRHRPRSNPVERFWAKVDRRGPDECWNWTAFLHKNGYAAFTPAHDDRKVMAHRYAYEITTGETIPDDLTIDHLCRNRACMNPAHMEVVTRGENARRGEGWVTSIKVRKAKADIACPQGHDREGWGYVTPQGHWRCRKCRSEYRKARRIAKREAA